MQLIYEGTDITRDVDIVRCMHHDVCGARCDCLEIELEHAQTWFRWRPQRDDVIRVCLDGYDTGRMYLNSILPEEGRFRILATSTPGTARRKAFGSWQDVTLADVMAACAAECGMRSDAYGEMGQATYPYLLRKDESAPAFLNRILAMEGAVLKAFDGKLLAIGIAYAQELAATQVMTMTSDQARAHYLRREHKKLGGITIKTPFASGAAVDTAAGSLPYEVYTHYPAVDAAQAGRWARGLLLGRNRQAEETEFHMEFNPGLTAMARVDIAGDTDAAGSWLVDEAEHDLYNRRSRVKLLRCMTTIG